MHFVSLFICCLVALSCSRSRPQPEPQFELYDEGGFADFSTVSAPKQPVVLKPVVLKHYEKKPPAPKKEPEELFRASDGFTQYENGVYSGLQTLNGPLELYNTQVTKYVMTDQKLAVDCSDIGGVNAGGEAWIHQSIVRQDSYFSDSVRFYESLASGNLTICGDLYACESHFEGDVAVEGDVTAEFSLFEGSLIAKAEMVDLQESMAQDIVIEETGPYYDHQLVRLAKGSLVKGNIIFKSGHGRVCVDSTSSLQGEIYGGLPIPPHYWQEH